MRIQPSLLIVTLAWASACARVPIGPESLPRLEPPAWTREPPREEGAAWIFVGHSFPSPSRREAADRALDDARIQLIRTLFGSQLSASRRVSENDRQIAQAGLLQEQLPKVRLTGLRQIEAYYDVVSMSDTDAYIKVSYPKSSIERDLASISKDPEPADPEPVPEPSLTPLPEPEPTRKPASVPQADPEVHLEYTPFEASQPKPEHPHRYLLSYDYSARSPLEVAPIPMQGGSFRIHFDSYDRITTLLGFSLLGGSALYKNGTLDLIRGALEFGFPVRLIGSPKNGLYFTPSVTVGLTSTVATSTAPGAGDPVTTDYTHASARLELSLRKSLGSSADNSIEFSANAEHFAGRGATSAPRILGGRVAWIIGW